MGSSRFKLINQSSEFVKFMMERLDVFEWKPIVEEDWPKFDELFSVKYTSESALIRIQAIYDQAYENLKSTLCFHTKGNYGVLISDPANPDKGEYLLSQHDKDIIITNSRYLEGWSKLSFELKHKSLEGQLK